MDRLREVGAGPGKFELASRSRSRGGVAMMRGGYPLGWRGGGASLLLLLLLLLAPTAARAGVCRAPLG
eukprot:COSAG04_NODE_1269_length_7482_cov_15.529077_1_plen_67_part_10